MTKKHGKHWGTKHGKLLEEMDNGDKIWKTQVGDRVPVYIYVVYI
jgi:hypothetical protein